MNARGLFLFDFVYVCLHASLFGSDSHGIGIYIAGLPRIKLELLVPKIQAMPNRRAERRGKMS